MSYESREKAREVRRNLGMEYRTRFPVIQLAKMYKLNVSHLEEADNRAEVAFHVGLHFKVDGAGAFANELLLPLHLLEPICLYKGIPTGERCFFGLFEKKRGYTTEELASKFGAPVWMVREQLARLL